jgi:hypothetical protein
LISTASQELQTAVPKQHGLFHTTARGFRETCANKMSQNKIF